MADAGKSPISKLLDTLGISREELSKRSDQMREFLRADSRDFEPAEPAKGSAASGSSEQSWRGGSLSRASSHSSLRDASPPRTPTSDRSSARYDSMEQVIERQRRQSRKERRSRRAAPSPTPSTTSRVSQSPKPDAPALTPQQSKYYRAHTALSGPSQAAAERQEHAYPPYHSIPDYVSTALAASKPSGDAHSVTPQAHRLISRPPPAQNSPLPPSSPPEMSPASSPVRGVPDIVSSPGPMSSPPKESEYMNLPYTLPPGPYSSIKPDFSYAAMIGQAILSSRQHRLTLQEIYDWITIVYPYYKRGEPTWMNSIRHVLSTTICFRKVPRERAIGRTLWAIFDDDLPCFAGGGFKKHLCKDYASSLANKSGKGAVKTEAPSAESPTKSKANRNTRKRPANEAVNSPAEQVEEKPSAPKRAKKASSSEATSQASSSVAVALPPKQRPRFFHAPDAHSISSHHQSYYELCVGNGNRTASGSTSEGGNSGSMFPPLLTASYQLVGTSRSGASPSDHDVATSNVVNTTTPQSDERTRVPLPSSSASISSVPDLTPNRSSSSPPPSFPNTSDADIDDYLVPENEIESDDEVTERRKRKMSFTDDVAISHPEDDDEDMFYSGAGNSTAVRGAQFWNAARSRAQPGSLLQPGIELQPSFAALSEDEDDDILPAGMYKGKDKNKIPPMQESPSAGRRKARRQSTPPRIATLTPPPCTPPRHRREPLKLSPKHTPLSHKGVYMSPSASLAHYKSNLDPPPALNFRLPKDAAENDSDAEVDQLVDDDDDDRQRTPRKRPSSSTSGRAPVHLFTPQRLPFPGSPFRTPNTSHLQNLNGGLFSASPSLKGLLDPFDASSILAAEMRGARNQGSPDGGLLGKGRQLLYDSPSAYGAGSGSRSWW